MLYKYAAYYVHADGKKTACYCESLRKYRAGELVTLWNRKKILIDFIVEGVNKNEAAKMV